MGTPEERAFEVVVLAASFRNPRGRPFIVENFPPSVVDLYDAVTASSAWAEAEDLTGQGLAVAQALRDDRDLEARYQADVDAGLLGFGAGEDAEMDDAILRVSRELDPPTAGDPPPEMPEPPAAEAPPDEPPPSEPPSVEPSLPAEEIETVLNAEIDGDRNLLEVQQTRTLTVYFAPEASEIAVGSAPLAVSIPEGQETIDLEVVLMSADFEIPPFPQPLRLKRDGSSVNRALFEITPLHAGESLLTVLVQVEVNFLQRMDIQFDVGTESAPTVVVYGRPTGSATVLEARDLSIQVEPAVGGFVIRAPQVCSEPVPILVTLEELDVRIESVRAALMQSVGEDANSFNLDLTEAERDKLLLSLATEGFLLFQAIFAGSNASPNLRKVGEWLRHELTGATKKLQIVSVGFPIPWALLYMADRIDEDALSWENFIGMHHIVEQVPRVLTTIRVADTVIESAPRLSVRVIFNDDIDNGMPSHPVAAQRDYWAARGVALSEGTRRDDLTKIALARAANDSVLYLYCHAKAKPDPMDSYLILTGQEQVTLRTLASTLPASDRLSARPLVFLNACESGEMSPKFYADFVSYFLEKGARGVIGTECKTPGLFASEWAKAFFDELFGGTPLGQAVLDVRLRFLNDHNNPYGLLYGVHCDADTVVAPALIRAG